MGDDYLAHYGTVGMRWYHRRYQNYDGTLTELGKKRLAQYTNRNAISGARSRYYSGKTENVNKAAGAARSIVSTTKQKVNQRERAAEEAEKQKIRDSIDLSSMSDEELRSAINRLQMEKQYKDLSMSQVRSSPEVQAGKDRVGKILDNLDTALAVGASAVALAGALASLFNVDFDGDGQPDLKKSKEKKDDSQKKENKNTNNSSSSSSNDTTKDPKSSWAYKAGQAVRSGMDRAQERREKAEQSRDIDSAIERALERSRAGYEPAERTERIGGTYGKNPLDDVEYTVTDSRVYGKDPFADDRGTPYGSGPIYARGYGDKKRRRGW